MLKKLKSVYLDLKINSINKFMFKILKFILNLDNKARTIIPLLIQMKFYK